MTEAPVDPDEEGRRAELITLRRKQIWRITAVMILAFLVGTTVLLIVLWLLLKNYLPVGI